MTLVAIGQKAKGKDQLKTALNLNLRNGDAQQAEHALALLN
jgi:hypothetical protein